ncbi:hypothetical protein [Nibribacter koreensis]|uniref:YD repeat-containing protein n=1 Tax=Nibribacter koreensis TaxID=1084519 RepID=A0ABP8F4Z2_9BACT
MFKQILSSFSIVALLCVMLGCADKEEAAPDPSSFDCLLLREQIAFATPGESLTRDYHFEGGFLNRVTDVYVGQRPSSTTTWFDYGAAGQIASTSLTDAQGLPLEAHEFIYDQQGLVKQVYVHNRKQNPGSSVLQPYHTKELTFNSKQQLVNLKVWTANTSPRMLLNDFAFTYDAKGNITQMQEYRVLRYSQSNPEDFNDLVLKVTFTHDNKVNPYHENLYVMFLPNTTILVPGLSTNNIVSTTSVSTLEGTKKGPGANYDPSAYNNTRTNTYTYNEQGRPTTVTSSVGSTRTFTYKCEK